MRSSLSSTAIALACTLSALSSATPIRSNTPRRPDLNAFVNHAITDTRSLVAEAKNDPEVADRYARLFKKSREQVIGYLGTLHREPLANTAEYTVYSAPPGVAFKSHQEILKKGTPIFADSEGRPKLIAKCGNPIGFPEQPLALVPVPVVETPTTSTDLASTRDADTEPTDLLNEIPPIIPEIPPLIAVGPTGVGALTSVIGVPSVGHVLPYLGLAPLLAPIFGSSSGSHSSIVIFPTPEPAPFAALALGAVALVRRRRKA